MVFTWVYWYLFIALILLQGRHKSLFIARPVSSGISTLNAKFSSNRSLGAMAFTSALICGKLAPPLVKDRCSTSSCVWRLSVLEQAVDELTIGLATLVRVIGYSIIICDELPKLCVDLNLVLHVACMWLTPVLIWDGLN